MKVKHQSGSELILKNEIIDAAATSAASEFRQNQLMKKPAVPAEKNRRMSSDDTGLCLSVIHFNKAFKGQG